MAKEVPDVHGVGLRVGGLGCIVVDGNMETVGAKPVVKVSDKAGDGQVENNVRKWVSCLGAGGVKGGTVGDVACCFEGGPRAGVSARRKCCSVPRRVMSGSARLVRWWQAGAGPHSRGVWVLEDGASNAAVKSTNMVTRVRRFCEVVSLTKKVGPEIGGAAL